MARNSSHNRTFGTRRTPTPDSRTRRGGYRHGPHSLSSRGAGRPGRNAVRAARIAQAPDLAPPPRPVPAETPEFDPLPDLPRPPDQPRSLLAPAPAGPPYDSAALPGPYFEPDPLLDPPQLPPPGWFADVETEIAKAHVQNKLTNASIPNGGAPDVVSLPSAVAGRGPSPRASRSAGRCSRDSAPIAVSYRFLATQGGDVMPAPTPRPR